MPFETLAQQQIPSFKFKLKAIPESVIPKDKRDILLGLVIHLQPIYEYLYAHPEEQLEIQKLTEIAPGFDARLAVEWDRSKRKLSLLRHPEMEQIAEKLNWDPYPNSVFEMGFSDNSLEFTGSDNCFCIRATEGENVTSIGFKLGMNQGFIKKNDSLEPIDLNQLKKRETQ